MSVIIPEAPSPDTLMAEIAGKVYDALLAACRTVTVYPAGHALSLNAIQQLYVRIDTYLETFGTLRFDIEKQHVLSAGVPLSTSPLTPGHPVFSLFRDGIQWLEFTEGLTPEELGDILNIIMHYKIPAAEPEGDIAIAFWEAQFPHLRYHVVDVTFSLRDTEQPDDFDNRDRTGDNAGKTDFPGKLPIRLEIFRTPGHQSPREDTIQTEIPPLPIEAIRLTAEETSCLRKQVDLDENSEPTAYLDALLDSLLQYQGKGSAAIIILTVMVEEFATAMARWDLDRASQILTKLAALKKINGTGASGFDSALEDFYRKISSPGILTPLRDIWCSLRPDQFDTFGKILEHLHPVAVESVAPLLLFAHAPDLQLMLERILLSFATQDPQPLRTLLQKPDERVLERLIPIICRLEDDKAFPLLLELAKHKSSRLRRMAVKAMVDSGPHRIRELFDLFVRDGETSIRQLLLEYLGRSKNELAEHHLLAYLQNSNLNSAPEELVMAGYATLGRCGSEHSIPYLRKTLMRWGWVPGYRRTLDRLGAALALANLEIPQSNQVLAEAERSWRPGIRKIVRQTHKPAVLGKRKK